MDPLDSILESVKGLVFTPARILKAAIDVDAMILNKAELKVIALPAG